MLLRWPPRDLYETSFRDDNEANGTVQAKFADVTLLFTDIVMYEGVAIRYSTHRIIPVHVCVCICARKRIRAHVSRTLLRDSVLEDDKFCCSHIFRDSAYVRG